MHIILTIVLISSVICKCIILILFLFFNGNLDSTDAGECQVHNKPDYLSLASNNNDDNLGDLSISDFENNFQTLLGLSVDQVDKKKKFQLKKRKEFYNN